MVDARKVTVEKRDAGIAWGAVYAQYQEDMSQVKQQGGELNVDKKLYVERLVYGTCCWRQGCFTFDDSPGSSDGFHPTERSACCLL